MSMLDNIKKEGKPKVTPRTSTIPLSSETNSEPRTPSLVEAQSVTVTPVTETNVNVEIEELNISRRGIKVRMEQEIEDQLTQLCQDNGFPVQNFVEACHLVLQEHPNMMKKVLKVARQKRDLRVKIGNQKRGRALMQSG